MGQGTGLLVQLTCLNFSATPRFASVSGAFLFLNSISFESSCCSTTVVKTFFHRGGGAPIKPLRVGEGSPTKWMSRTGMFTTGAVGLARLVVNQ